MATAPFETWLRRVLYRATLTAAGAFALLLIAAPLLPLDPHHGSTTRLWHMLAKDDTLRQVAVVSAVGWWITALVFFRARKYAEEPARHDW